MNLNFGAETSQVLRSNCIVINLFPCTPYTEILITKIQIFILVEMSPLKIDTYLRNRKIQERELIWNTN